MDFTVLPSSGILQFTQSLVFHRLTKVWHFTVYPRSSILPFTQSLVFYRLPKVRCFTVYPRSSILPFTQGLVCYRLPKVWYFTVYVRSAILADVGDPFVSENLWEFYASDFYDGFLVRAYTIFQYDQTLISCTISSKSPRYSTYILFFLIFLHSLTIWLFFICYQKTYRSNISVCYQFLFWYIWFIWNILCCY